MKTNLPVLAVASLVAAFAATTVAAQAQNVRVRGAIESVDGNTVMVKSRDGASLKLVLKDNANVRGVVKASLDRRQGGHQCRYHVAAARRRNA